MKKIKKIILVVIVSLIALISVFSCFKGKYTPEPILTPVSVLKPANSVNDDVISPTGTYDYIYFNTSLSHEYIHDLILNLPKNQITNSYLVYGYIYNDERARVLSLGVFDENSARIEVLDLYFSNMEAITINAIYEGNEFTKFTNPYNAGFSGGLATFEFQGININIGQQNN